MNIYLRIEGVKLYLVLTVFPNKLEKIHVKRRMLGPLNMTPSHDFHAVAAPLVHYPRNS